MIDEIEELWSLADECREWANAPPRTDVTAETQLAYRKIEFKRLANKLDDIAGRLAARMPT